MMPLSSISSSISSSSIINGSIHTSSISSSSFLGCFIFVFFPFYLTLCFFLSHTLAIVRCLQAILWGHLCSRVQSTALASSPERLSKSISEQHINFASLTSKTVICLASEETTALRTQNRIKNKYEKSRGKKEKKKTCL